VPLDSLRLQPTIAWAGGFADAWQPGEAGAAANLSRFLDGPVVNYGESRNLPGITGTSRLSPHLHFGEISPRQVWHAAPQWRTSQFMAEIGWREFAHHLLFHFPHTSDQPLRPEYTKFPWARDEGGVLRAWQRGRTGIPLVDAGMRQLHHEGWMHNRTRMVTASFLTKHLYLDWRLGAWHFMDHLADGDLANNFGQWQWTAGTGTDSRPNRVFNPVIQGERYDPDGTYVRRWVPELAGVAGAAVHQPRPPGAGPDLFGGGYPAPIVEHREARERFLAARGGDDARRAQAHHLAAGGHRRRLRDRVDAGEGERADGGEARHRSRVALRGQPVNRRRCARRHGTVDRHGDAAAGTARAPHRRAPGGMAFCGAGSREFASRDARRTA
jgi:deoxyribodipyrimidine photo-lyase